MATFLTEAWITELDEAASAITTPAGLRLTVQQHVTMDDGSTRSFAIRIAAGRVAVTIGEAPDADVTLTQDVSTAAAIARGEMSAQVAFISGRLRVGGDLRRVMDDARALEAMGDVFAATRGVTTW